MKKLTKYIIITLAILVAELVGAYILLITSKYKSDDTPYKSALIQMLVAVATFYPTILVVDKYMKTWSKDYLNKMQKATSNKFWGLMIGFCVAIILLLMGFVKILYNRSMLEDIADWFERFI
jgi:ABC-type uncharacterized transport system fused permease/ATPase subunit